MRLRELEEKSQVDGFWNDPRVAGQVSKEINEIKEVKDKIAALLARKQVIETLQADRVQTVYLLDELVRQMPEGVFLKSVKQKGLGVELLGILMQRSATLSISHSLPPTSPTVNIPLDFASFSPSTTFCEFPLVEMPMTTSSFIAQASSCLLKTAANSLSFAIAVIVELFAVRAIAGSAFLSSRNFPRNSAAMCCASAAEPPFPIRMTLPPFL